MIRARHLAPVCRALIECHFSSWHCLGLKREGGNDFGKQECRKSLFGGLAIRYIYENPSALSLGGMQGVLNASLKYAFSLRYEVPEIHLCRWAEFWFDEFLTYLTSIDRLWPELYCNFRPQFLSGMRAHCPMFESPLWSNHLSTDLFKLLAKASGSVGGSYSQTFLCSRNPKRIFLAAGSIFIMWSNHSSW